jgi:hypothetical protein
VAEGTSQRLLRRLTGGGTAGNEELTAVTAVILLILLAAIGVTIVRVHQLLSEHMFLGMLLLGPVVLKMSSTGYRFMRYYTGNARYVSKGPPELIMRLTAPFVVLSTIAVFGTGVVLLVAGPSVRHPVSELHKLSFFAWIAFTAVHVLGHLAQIPTSLRASEHTRDHAWEDYGSGRGGRALALAGAIVGGLVLAILVEPLFAAWTNTVTFPFH